MANIQILLTTYNGEKYLPTQLDSILAQSNSDWHLVISDDGSSDRSAAIAEQLRREHPEKVTLAHSGRRFGNAKAHFMWLLENYGDAPYVMFCDQDDRWHSDKIEKTLAAMRAAEGGHAAPVLVYGDLQVVDEELRCIAPSFMVSSCLDGKKAGLRRLLTQNTVTGCTMMVNRPLVRLACACGYDERMLMHDWWLALLAAAAGKLVYLDLPLIDYRQHGDNSVGAKDARSLGYIRQRLFHADLAQDLRNTCLQAEALLQRAEPLLSAESAAIIREYAENAHRGWLARRVSYLRGGYLKSGAPRIVGQMLWG
ncbi:MAG: glycosyltransferase family 2 protein [Firmicutes bacterium]|nr:glycosyltransferase family 2 protein [Bacillota bacterium]